MSVTNQEPDLAVWQDNSTSSINISSNSPCSVSTNYMPMKSAGKAWEMPQG